MPEQLERLTAALADTYAIEGELGEGGMATVYLARDLKHDRHVAVKVFRPELAASMGTERFLREIQVTAKLHHPHILALYDSGEADGFLYYVMPYVEGETLGDLMTREQQLPLHDAMRITREVAEALSYAHSYGLVHRDIKPANIMLSGGHAVVADFGIARAVSEAGAEKITQTGMAIGTPAYMSPEQAAGDERMDGRSDIYALGCVLYEMLVGQIPFPAPTPQAMMARHSIDQVPSPAIMRQSIPEELEDIVYTCLEKSPADRFRTANELVEALTDLDSGTFAMRRASRAISGPGMRRTTRVMAQPKQSRRNIVIAAGIVITAGLGIAGWQLWPWGDSGAGATTGPDPRSVAVLYFEDRSPDASLAYLSDALTETLIQRLSEVPGLRVVSRHGVRQYQGSNVTLDSISRALAVGTVVDGTVAQSGDQLRVSVSLVDASSGDEIDGTTIDRPRGEIFALQDELAREVSMFLRTGLGEEIQLRERRAGTESAEAWDLVQRALSTAEGADPLLEEGDVEAASRELSRADSLLERSEALDPEWVTPAAQRAWLSYRQARLAGAFDRAHNDRWTRDGLAHADRAVSLDTADADALEARATLAYWRHLLNLPPVDEGVVLVETAERDFRASVAANPGQASAWGSLSHLLMNRSETAEAKLAALRSYGADPYLANVERTLWRLFQSSMDLDDGIEAERWCGEGFQRFPEDPRFTECQLQINALRGRTPDIDEAWQLLDQYAGLYDPGAREYRRLRGQMFIAWGLARAGMADSARGVAERSRGNSELDPTRELALYEAILHNILEDNDEAFRALSVYLAANPDARGSFARSRTWWLENLRSDPRYRQLVAN
jgi:serine/threonine-protein kinase